MRPKVCDAGLLSCAVFLVLAAVVPAVYPAPMAEEFHEFDLPAGLLTDTLIEIGRNCNVIVSFQPDLADQLMAPPVRGRLTLRQALSLATQPSGLVPAVTAGGVVSVVAAAPPAAATVAAGADALPPAVATSAAELAGTLALPRVEIFGSPRQSDGLRALRGWSATRTDAPLSDLPQQVSVLTGEALAAQGATRSTEATRYITGVVLSRGVDYGSQGPGGGDGLILNSMMARGMPAAVALSGMRTVRNMVPVDTLFLDRIEVAKGPTSVLSGISDYGGRGGQVNLVRKQAGPDVHTEVMQSLSSQDHGTLRLGADLGGTLGAGAYWRMVGHAGRTGTTEGGYTGQYAGGLLGALCMQRGDLRLRLAVQVDRQRLAPAPASRGGMTLPDGSITPVAPGRVDPLDPTDRSLVSTADVEFDLEMRLSPSWRTTWKGRVEGSRSDHQRHQPGTADVLQRESVRDAGMQAGLAGQVGTGAVVHKLMLGLDLERWYLWQEGTYFGQPRLSVESREYRQAILLQDQMSAGPWRVRLAVQRGFIPERVRMGFADRVSAPVPATSWDAGVLYRWSPSTAVYAGTQMSVETENRRSGLKLYDGSDPPNTRLRQWQLGAKRDLLDGRLALTLEAFRLRELDRLQGSPPISLQSIPGRFVDGVELELTGQPTPALDLYLGLAGMKGTSWKPGLTPEPGVPWMIFRVPADGLPERSLRLLAHYRLPGAQGSGTRLGLAVLADSAMVGSAGFNRLSDGMLRLPGGAKVDLSLARSVGPWTVDASVHNLFDRQLYGTLADTLSIPLLPGRSVAVTATFRE